ncbi:MAG: ParB/RepB/Spo0J family partition protein [Pseudomonadota bacterium]
MAEETSNRRLGRGLAALMGDVAPEPAAVDQARGSRKLPIEQIRPNPNNPRQSFDDEDLRDLTNSVQEKGIIQPLLVRMLNEGSYELVAGERRWRAAQRAGLDTVPVVVRDVDEKESLEIAIIENVQRADLNAVEEAEGYQQLIDRFGYTQKQLSSVIGKSRSHIANTLRLLKLPAPILAYVSDGGLSAGHARQLIDRDDASDLARKVIDDDLSVRQLEDIVRLKSVPKGEATADGKTVPARASVLEADAVALGAKLEEHLGLAVSIKAKTDGSGQVSIQYRTLEQLDGLLSHFGVS